METEWQSGFATRLLSVIENRETKRQRKSATMIGDHDTTETLDIIAIHSVPGCDAVAGRASDGCEYVRMYRTENALGERCTPPVPTTTVKHGNAYGYVMGLGGFEAEGIA